MWGTFFRESPFSRCVDTKDTTGDAGDTNDTRDSGKPSFGEGFPEPFRRTCLRVMAVMPCLAAYCLRQNYGVFLRKLLKSLQAAFFRSFLKNPPEFPLCEAKFFPRQGRKPFNLKVKLTYRAHTLLNRTLAERGVITLSVYQV